MSIVLIYPAISHHSDVLPPMYEPKPEFTLVVIQVEYSVYCHSTQSHIPQGGVIEAIIGE